MYVSDKSVYVSDNSMNVSDIRIYLDVPFESVLYRSFVSRHSSGMYSYDICLHTSYVHVSYIHREISSVF